MMRFFFILVSFICQSQSITQDVIATDGVSYYDDEITFEWTIGEFTYTTLNNFSVTLTQGFHQPFSQDITIADLIINQINVFPNPTKNKVLIELDLSQKVNIKIQLFDLKGVLLKEKHLFHNKIFETVHLQGFANGIYQIEVTIENNFPEIFKIIKI